MSNPGRVFEERAFLEAENIRLKAELDELKRGPDAANNVALAACDFIDASSGWLEGTEAVDRLLDAREKLGEAVKEYRRAKQ